MTDRMSDASPSKSKLWTGRILSGIAAAFLLLDAGMKVVRAHVAVEGTTQLGYPDSSVFGIGLLLLFCTLLYIFPRTAPVGAVLLTGYLGGAVATNVRVSAPLFTHVLFPVYMAVFIWGGLYLRDRRVQTLVSTN